MGYEYCHHLSDHLVAGLWESLICRQIFVDDEVTTFLDYTSKDEGVNHEANKSGAIAQIVILGAGYDDRFYRLDCIRANDEKLTLIEVDQPEVQKRKKKGLKRMGIIGETNANENNGMELKNDEVESYGFTNTAIDEGLIEDGKANKVDLADKEKIPAIFVYISAHATSSP